MSIFTFIERKKEVETPRPVIDLIRQAREQGCIISYKDGGLIYIGDSPREEMRHQVEAQEKEVVEYIERQFEPRRDLQGDSSIWELILKTAWEKYNLNLHGLMHGIRCYGARLQFKNSQLKILAPEDDQESWEEIREDWLLPAKDEIKFLFGEVETNLSKTG